MGSEMCIRDSLPAVRIEVTAIERRLAVCHVLGQEPPGHRMMTEAAGAEVCSQEQPRKSRHGPDVGLEVDRVADEPDAVVIDLSVLHQRQPVAHGLEDERQGLLGGCQGGEVEVGSRVDLLRLDRPRAQEKAGRLGRTVVYAGSVVVDRRQSGCLPEGSGDETLVREAAYRQWLVDAAQ